MSQLAIDTLIRTADIALVAVALSSVYSLVKFPNVALVQYATVGAFLGLGLHNAGLPLVGAASIACLLVGVLAVALNIWIFGRLLRAGSAIAMVGSLAVSMILAAFLLVLAGPAPQRFQLPIHPPLRMLGARLTELQAWSFVVASAALIGFGLVLFRTDLGRCMRATATNPILAQATGIDTRRTTWSVVFLSGALASLGGILLAVVGEVSIQAGTDMLLAVFAAAILGGLGNAMGAIAGAFIIALAETAVIGTNLGPLFAQPFLFMPVSYASAASFVILVLALLVRPHGLFVSEVKRV
jgi:branched-chain amino acid transport system permease protein